MTHAATTHRHLDVACARLWMVDGGNHGVTNYPYAHLSPGADWLRENLG